MSVCRCPESGATLWGSAMLMCRQKPDLMKTQAETMDFTETLGAEHELCPHISMAQIEVTTKSDKSVVPTGLLVCCGGPAPHIYSAVNACVLGIFTTHPPEAISHIGYPTVPGPRVEGRV